jgi:hypothetical protein
LRDGKTILDGKFINYNVQGIIISEGQYKENEPLGLFKYYYDNGKLESVSYRKKSKIDLESTYYNQDGSINQYTLYDDFGKTAFFIKFDKRIVQKYDGYSTYPVGQYKIENEGKTIISKNDTLSLGSVVQHEYLLANIPYTIRTFKIEVEGFDNLKVKREFMKTAPTHITIKEVLIKKGHNRINAFTQYKFLDNVTPVKNDTVSFDIFVK